MDKNFILQLPNQNGNFENIETKQSLVFIGANGSGKTRLGTWIEMSSPQKQKVHRISAQKSLSMPDAVTPTSIDKAEKALLYGYADAIDSNIMAHKEHQRWGKKPSTSLLNDFQHLMVYLFSDDVEVNSKYKHDSQKSLDKIPPPASKLDKVKKVWDKILPHRELVLKGLKIETRAKSPSSKSYNGSEMSDGERVIFYLVGQCLSVPQDGIIIVDEPEIHLHKSVQAPLWQEIEKLRPDCLFVYMTHDVDFTVALTDTTKIWLKSYDGSQWKWEIIPDIEGLPEELLVEILGSRKPVVFVEGENGSYDVSLYRAILKDFLVIPCGSCTQVIQQTKVLRDSKQFHNLEVFGLIDRDRRVDNEIESLQEKGIYTLCVAEVENLFCTPEVIKLVSKQLERTPEDDIDSVSQFIFKKMQSELETQVSLRVASEIKHKLNLFNEKAKGKENLKSALQSLLNEVNVDYIYDINNKIFSEAVERKDYLLLLKIYNRKSLASQISSCLGLAKDKLAELVVRLANGQKNEEVTQALLPYLGDFAGKLSPTQSNAAQKEAAPV